MKNAPPPPKMHAFHTFHAAAIENANVFEIDLFVQRNVVGAEHAGRLRRRGACEQQKHGCRSHRATRAGQHSRSVYFVV